MHWGFCMHTSSRTLLFAVLPALLVAACGGNGAIAPTTSVPPETTTTTVPATSTTVMATTTTVPMPEIETGPMPELPPASLTEDYGGPLTIETVCIDLEVSPVGIGAPESVRADLAQTFASMGVEVVDADCDLSLGVDLSAHRYSAEYENVGECFTGYDGGGDIVASAAGEQWDWGFGVAKPTSEFIIGDCDGDQAPPGGPVPASAWVPDFIDVFGDLFGPQGRVAAYLGLPEPLNVDVAPILQPEGVTYDALTAALYSDSPKETCRAARLIRELAEEFRSGGGWVPPSDDAADDDDEAVSAGPELLALVPYLIDRLIAAETEGWNCPHRDIEWALEVITDEDPDGGARGWAEWWLQTPEGQASIDEPSAGA